MESAVQMRRTIKKVLLKSRNLSLPYSLAVKVSLEPEEIRLNQSFAVISFDDQSPVFDENRNIDYGVINGELDKFLKEMLQKECAVTSFVIPNFKLDHTEPWLYNLSNYPFWVRSLQVLEGKKFEIAGHGFTHVQNNLPFQQHCEFAFVKNDTFYNSLRESLECFRQSGLDIIGFRTPGWDLSSDIRLSEFSDFGIKYIGGSSLNAGFNGGIRRVSYIHPCLIDGLVNIPQNVEIGWEFSRIRKEIDTIISFGGVVSIKAHFATQKVANCLSKENQIKLLNVIDYINETHGIPWKTYKELYEECVNIISL